MPATPHKTRNTAPVATPATVPMLSDDPEPVVYACEMSECVYVCNVYTCESARVCISVHVSVRVSLCKYLSACV